MAANINLVVLTGRVGGEPEIKRFNSGDEVAEFSVATSEYWRDRQGERQQKTQWHRVKVLGDHSIKVVREYVNKGDLISIEDNLQYRQWEKDGVKHTMAEVVVGPFKGAVKLGPKSENNSGGRDDDRGRSRDDRRDDRRRDDSRKSSQGSMGYNHDLDDEIPFAPEWRI